jgi:hypothetical protein
MKFKNNNNMDVYVDLGTLRRVSPGEVIDLPGALKCEGLYQEPLSVRGCLPCTQKLRQNLRS